MEIIRPDFKKAAKAIKEGKVLVCPTDTVYGLICDAANKKAVIRLYKIKRRPKSKPIPIFVSDIKMAKKFAEINWKQEKFLKKFWPGAVTAVLPSRGKKGTVGVRIPHYDWLLHLVEQLGRPLAETSANISGKHAAIEIKEVLRYFKNKKYKPDLVLDGGDLKPNKPSKVIDLTGKKAKILRK